ncbi:hypothetical protein TWF694_010251 [Orbilia ellipsospora]|uniref:Uncharacterized protein n=1 Tax=Orbilia ellipsospora TaxID=2528407 RepID=A0AAV9XAH7_9PEZI
MNRISLFVVYVVSSVAVQVDIQWGTSNPFLQDLRSFQPESEFYNQTAPRLQQTFFLTTDRTHNRMEKTCKQITQPWTQAKNRSDKDYLRRTGFVKAIRITQTPQTIPANKDIPPFTHPYPRSARGIAFFGNDNCKDQPKFLIWPKQAFDMDYPTSRRYEILRSPTEVENFWYKWAQTFEFSDFDVKKDPNSHYHSARPQFWNAIDPEDTRAINAFLQKYPENGNVKKNMLASPFGSPYHQPFGSFREIFPTKEDDIWKKIVSPSSSDYKYWDIPMINVQLDERNGAGEQKSDPFMSFIPYALMESSRATVFDLIEEEYARFYQLMVDILGTPGSSWLRNLKWSTSRQKDAINRLAAVADPRAIFHTETVKSLERFPGEKNLGKLKSYQIYTSSPSVPDPREWVLPPFWLNVPVWNPNLGRMVKGPNGQIVPNGAYEMVRNPNRIIYSSVQIITQPNGKKLVQTVPVVSNPVSALEKQAVVLFEELPLADFLSQSSRRVPIIPDYARSDSQNGALGQYYGGSAVGDDTLQEFTIPTRQRSSRVSYTRRPPPSQPRLSQDEALQAIELQQKAQAQLLPADVDPNILGDVTDVPTRQRSKAVYNPRPPIPLQPEPAEHVMDMEASIPTRQRSRTLYSRPELLQPYINTGADLITGQPDSAMSEEFVPSDSSGGTAGSLSSLADSIFEERNKASNILQVASMDIEGASDLIESMDNYNLLDQIQKSQKLQIEQLAGSQASYRPPVEMLESINSMLQSRRRQIPSELDIQFLEDSVVNFQPQNLRENILLASRHPNVNGDIIVPIGEDVNGLTESLVINSKRLGSLA